MEDLPTVITIDDVIGASTAEERQSLPPVLTVEETAARGVTDVTDVTDTAQERLEEEMP